MKEKSSLWDRAFFRNFLFNEPLFKILLLLGFLTTSIPLTKDTTSPYLKVLLLWGAGIVFFLLCRNIRRFLKNKTLWVLLLFATCYLGSILWNYQGHLVENVKSLAYIVLIFLLFYGVDRSREITSVKKEIGVLSEGVIVVSFLLSLTCFFLYLASVSVQFILENGTVTYIGMYDNRLWGLYNPNTGSMINSLSILISVVYLFARRKLPRWFLIVNIVVQYFCLTLTSSRTALYCLALLLALTLMVLLWWHCSFFAAGGIKGALRRVAVVLVAVICVAEAPVFLKIPLSYLPGTVRQIEKVFSSSDNAENKGPIEQVELSRKEELEDRDGGVLSGRMYLWKAGFSAFKQSPVFGITRENIYDKAKDLLPTEAFQTKHDWRIDLKVGGLHNMYMTILVSSGILGFLILAFFVLWTLKKMGFYFVKTAFEEQDHLFLLCTAIVLLFFCSEFFEARVLYRTTVFNGLFWLYYGYAVYFTDRPLRMSRQKE